MATGQHQGRPLVGLTLGLAVLLFLANGLLQAGQQTVSGLAALKLARPPQRKALNPGAATSAAASFEPAPAPPDLLSILTPIFPDAFTLGLLRNQLRTFDHFFAADSITEWVLVTPRAQLPVLQQFVDEQLAQLSIPPAIMRLVADEDCAPELAMDTLLELFPQPLTSWLSGWAKQQLVKLACAELLATPYYLITDADLLYLDATGAPDLLEAAPCTAATPICNEAGSTSYRARSETQPHQVMEEAGGREQEQWERHSARTLGLPYTAMDQAMGVTPQILSRDIVRSIARHIQTQLVPASTKILLNTTFTHVQQNVSAVSNWRQYLLRELVASVAVHEEGGAWTEYDLYWIYAHHTGLWDRHHVRSYLQCWQLNVWKAHQFPGWQPCAKAEEAAQLAPGQEAQYKGHWAVVQSDIKIEGPAIWEKLEPCLRIHSAVSLQPS